MPRFSGTVDGRWRRPATMLPAAASEAAGATCALALVRASGISAAIRTRDSGASVASIYVRLCHIGEGSRFFSRFPSALQRSTHAMGFLTPMLPWSNERSGGGARGAAVAAGVLGLAARGLLRDRAGRQRRVLV